MNEFFTVLFSSMLPITELRGAIPFSLTFYKLPVFETYVAAVIGNIIPVFFILLFLPSIVKYLSRNSKFFAKFFEWLFERTRRKFYTKHARFGDWALVLFVAIPLPVTGAWTGALAAWLFGISYKKSVGLIFVGLLISGLIVTLLTTGALRLFS
jgi:uncharacterized membrane protein